MPGRVHVIGAGLAGLAAGVRLAARGRAVSLYEGGQHAGGRCRSYFDRELDCRIDNGNHLLLSGNHAALAYLDEIGARASMLTAAEPAFDFCDLRNGTRWTLRLNRGRFPAWVFAAGRRVPGTRVTDYLAALRLPLASANASAQACLGTPRLLHERLWEPFCVAALNTEAAAGSARLVWAVVRETFGRGGGACVPMVPEMGLSESFVDPALARLRSAGAAIHFGQLLRQIRFQRSRVEALVFGDSTVEIGPEDAVVLAVPPTSAAGLLPGVTMPTEHRAIVNAHYRLPSGAASDFGLGLVGGLAQWVFRKRDVISVTISAADAIVDRSAEDLAAAIWRDVGAALALPAAPMPRWRIVKERRATFAATPAQDARRPGPRTRWSNLLLAGDWTATGLPATIEGAVRSGHRAAAAIGR
ncbi:MAG TPA: hydroxysqualene dehydroxylase HpnE [Candidatus Sulfotelmatobacter sp.]|nr:hydroxysqualene dehydroxylase HpnE [Candidatus Sulfotelmatobacter sp.]